MIKRIIFVFIVFSTFLLIDKIIENDIKDIIRIDYNKIIEAQSSDIAKEQHKYLNLILNRKIILRFVEINNDTFMMVDNYWNKKDVTYKFKITKNKEIKVFEIEPIYKYLKFFRNGTDFPSYHREWIDTDKFNYENIKQLWINSNKINVLYWYNLDKGDIKSICKSDEIIFQVKFESENESYKIENDKLLKRFLCYE